MPADSSAPYRRSRYGFRPGFDREEMRLRSVGPVEEAVVCIGARFSQNPRVLPRPFAYDQTVKTIARIATWIDSVLTTVVGVALRGATAFLAFVLRRGSHRPWRRRAAAGWRSNSRT
jgi:hypothetical protein